MYWKFGSNAIYNLSQFSKVELNGYKINLYYSSISGNQWWFSGFQTYLTLKYDSNEEAAKDFDDICKLTSRKTTL